VFAAFAGERRMSWLGAGVGLGNVLLALFFLPRSPALDELELYTAVYAKQHYGQLFYPAYDLPAVFGPTKPWLVATLCSFGVSLRLATAGLFAGSFLFASFGVFACRFRLFETLAALAAISAAVTLFPFLSYNPENLTYDERIGRLRPDDLVLTLWLGGLFWLEASRRRSWRGWHSFLGGLSIGLGCVTHFYALPALGVVLVYGAAAIVERSSGRIRRLAPIAIGVALAVCPTLIAQAPHLRTIAGYLVDQAGDPASRAAADAWRRHTADFWFLWQWTKRHAGSVWPAAALLAGPASIGLPPVVPAGVMLLAFRSTRVLGLAGLVLPLVVLRVSHKSSGYELPEIALFLLACGFSLAALLERLTGRARRLAAWGFVGVLATASPLFWQPSSLRFMDESHSPKLLRAMGRAVVGPGASVVGPFYVSGGDDYVQHADVLEPGIDFVAEREFHLASGRLHRLYRRHETRLAGFVLTPEMPSASTVYFSAREERQPLAGFVVWNGKVQEFSSSGAGWQLRVLSCHATPEELSWVSPRTPVPIAGYVPRTDHCVASTLRAKGLESRSASAFLRRTWSFSSMADEVMVPLLIDDAADAEVSPALELRCGCETLERFSGSLSDVSAQQLLLDLRRSDRTIRFFAGSPDLVAGRDMASRFAPGRRE